MKHIQLFENYGMRDFEENRLGTGEIKIGFTGDGGNGSHPSIFSKYVLENLIDPLTQFDFIATASTDNLPEALICLYDDDQPNGWFIQPISSMVASQAMKLMGKNHIDGLWRIGEKEGMEILRMVDYKGSSEEIHTISVIPNPKLNTIYWSDNPEYSHGYWKPPYKEITMSIS